MGVKIDHNKIDMYCEKTLLDDKNNIVGHVRSAAYSPTFKKVIGIAMIQKPYFNKDQKFEINLIDKTNKNIHTGKVCELPFV